MLMYFHVVNFTPVLYIYIHIQSIQYLYISSGFNRV